MNINNIILLIFVINILATAIGDGLRQRDITNPNFKLGMLYHMFWALSYVWLGLLVIDVPIGEAPRYLIAYVLLRFGLFDSFRNIANRKKAYYIGNTAGIDRLAGRIFAFNFGPEIYMVLKVIAAIVGCFLIQYYHNYFN